MKADIHIAGSEAQRSRRREEAHFSTRHAQRMSAPPHVGSYGRGFTLMEMLVVLMLIMILTGIGSFSFGGFDAVPAIQHPIDKLADMAKTATREAVTQGRTIVIGFDKKGFAYYGEDAENDTRFTYPKGMKLGVKRWNSGKNFMPVEQLNWPFYATGVSEAYTFQFKSEEGVAEVSFNPLTGSVLNQSVIAK
jgi:prepilin-type N-terminal cleavage/methylation domain-containing protein